MESPVLEIDKLEVVYGGAIVGLAGLSLTVPAGGMIALLGTNGAGKSTTLKAVSNLLPFEGGRVTGGTIRFLGKNIAGLAAYKLSRQGLLHVREGRRVFPSMTVEENLVAATFALTGRAAQRRKERLADVYSIFPHLERRRHLHAGFLSGGEQQMLAIGRALVGEPQLMLLDEASLGLAPLVAAEIFEIVARINRERGISVLMVEQNAALALKHASYGYVLDSGRLVLEGPAAELRTSPLVIERYLGGKAGAAA